MIVDLIRYNEQSDYSDGMFLIDGKFECFSIEDEERTKKVYGETRIPCGFFEIKLRKEGRFHRNYLKKFGSDFHHGMLCITNAPDWKLIAEGLEFQYILIHIGNDDDDTAGCPLVGMTAHADKNFIAQSTVAYKRLYPKIVKPLLEGKKVYIRVSELEVEGQ